MLLKFRIVCLIFITVRYSAYSHLTRGNLSLNELSKIRNISEKVLRVQRPFQTLLQSLQKIAPRKSFDFSAYDLFTVFPCLLIHLAKIFDGKEFLLVTSEKRQSLICDADSHDYLNVSFPRNPSRFYLQSELLVWKLSEIKRFLVVCSFECTLKILQTAKDHGLHTKTYTWIILDEIFPTELREMTLNGYRINLGMQSKQPSSHGANIFLAVTRLNSQVQQNNTIHLTVHCTSFSCSSNDIIPQHMHTNTNHGKSLKRIVTIIDSPFTKFHPLDPDSVESPKCITGRVCWKYDSPKKLVPKCCVGFCMDLLGYLEEELNFEPYVYIVEDSMYGDKINGTWVGLVGDLIKNKADMVLASITINQKRSQVVQFSDSFMMAGVSIATLMQTKTIPLINFEVFSPLSGLMWATLIIVVFAVSCIVSLSEKYGSFIYTFQYKWSESIVYIVGRLFERDIGYKSPSNLSSRTVITFMGMAMMIIMSTYTAMLTANGLIYKHKLPITGFNDKKIVDPTTAFKYGSIKNSAFTQMVKHSSDPNWNKMYHFMKQYSFVSTEDAVDKLKKGELHAIVSDTPVLLHYIAKEKDCKIQLAGPPVSDAGFGIAIQKNSSLKPYLDMLVRKYQENDVLRILKKRWFSSQCVNKNSEKSEEAKKFDLRLFAGIFVMIVLFLVVILFIFCGEHLVSKLTAKYNIH